MVRSPAELTAAGVSRSVLVANLAADRWQRQGLAIVLHRGPLSSDQRWRVALINCGPRSLLTAFTAAELMGLTGWKRDEVHVLAPTGSRSPRYSAIPIRLHRSEMWPVGTAGRLRSQSLAPALVRAAGTCTSPRPACGILAAAVQQRLLSPAQLRDVLLGASRAKHRAALLSAVQDIEGGSQALSEIDFVRLCRRERLPLPIQQELRRDSFGRRRYLDATWRLPDGRLLVVEVDGALHLNPRRWWDDQLRQNELSLAGAVVLRFPSVVVRCEPALVVRQLRAALRNADAG